MASHDRTTHDRANHHHTSHDHGEFRAMLEGYRLTTAEILYRLPDHPVLIQSYIWQDYDLHPRFPRLKSFLDFWTAKLEGPLYRVTVAHAALVRPAELKLVGAEFRLN